MGSVRSLLPNEVKILALTATATQETLKCVVSRPSMQDPAIIGLSPDRPNIKLSVQPCPSIPKMCEWLAKELLEKRTTTLNTVVFCRSLHHCADMCMILKKLLGKKSQNLKAFQTIWCSTEWLMFSLQHQIQM